MLAMLIELNQEQRWVQRLDWFEPSFGETYLTAGASHPGCHNPGPATAYLARAL